MAQLHETDYLIIGNSAAGVTAAEYIRAVDDAGKILIVSHETHSVYGRPLISYLLEGKTTEETMGFRDDSFYEASDIDTLLGPDYEVVTLDPSSHQARFVNGDAVAYGRCLLATGSVPFVPSFRGIKGKENVYPFMTLDHALSAKEATVRATKVAHAQGKMSRVVVIGAGLIGLKAAEALSYHADEIVVLELAGHILPAVLDEQGATVLSQHLAAHNIFCRSGISADEFSGANSSEEGTGANNLIEQALLTNGEILDCDVVITAVGVRPNSALAVEAGAQQGRGLVVGDDLQTSLPDIYAAGDVVQVTDLLDGSKRPLALWPNAIRQGKIAGLAMAKSPDAEEFIGSFAVNAVDFFEDSLLTAGLINPPEEAGYESRILAGENTYAKFVMQDDYLIGYILLNQPTNAGIYTAIIEQKIPLSTLDKSLFTIEPLNLSFSSSERWERLHAGYPEKLDEFGRKQRA